jgi:hypothetical protein
MVDACESGILWIWELITYQNSNKMQLEKLHELGNSCIKIVKEEFLGSIQLETSFFFECPNETISPTKSNSKCITSYYSQESRRPWMLELSKNLINSKWRILAEKANKVTWHWETVCTWKVRLSSSKHVPMREVTKIPKEQMESPTITETTTWCVLQSEYFVWQLHK